MSVIATLAQWEVAVLRLNTRDSFPVSRDLV